MRKHDEIVLPYVTNFLVSLTSVFVEDKTVNYMTQLPWLLIYFAVRYMGNRIVYSDISRDLKSSGPIQPKFSSGLIGISPFLPKSNHKFMHSFINSALLPMNINPEHWLLLPEQYPAQKSKSRSRNL